MKKLSEVWESAFWNFIVLGREPAVENGSCRYLTSDGRKCAFGLLIPDGHEGQKRRIPADLFCAIYGLFERPTEHNPAILQGMLHDSIWHYKEGCYRWKYPKPLMASIYIIAAEKFNLKVGWFEMALCRLISKFSFLCKEREEIDLFPHIEGYEVGLFGPKRCG